MLNCLDHPTGYVREAAISYLQVASPRSLVRVLPRLLKDRDPLVLAQARAISYYFQNNGKNNLNLSDNSRHNQNLDADIQARMSSQPHGES